MGIYQLASSRLYVLMLIGNILIYYLNLVFRLFTAAARPTVLASTGHSVQVSMFRVLEGSPERIQVQRVDARVPHGCGSNV